MSGVLLKRLYLHNFKSFWESEFEFGKLNCLIAPNNTGKSNLIEALVFLDNLIYQSPAKAIAKAGLKKIKNYHYNESEVKFEALFDIKNKVLVVDELFEYEIECKYVFTLDTESKTTNTDIAIFGKIKSLRIDKSDLNNMLAERRAHALDEVIKTYAEYSKELEDKQYRSFEFLCNQNTLHYRINTRYDSTEEMVKKLFNLKISDDTSYLEKTLNLIFVFYKFSLFSSHYFHPHTMKRTQNVGERYLLEDGTNLSEYLKSLDKNIFEDISTSLIGEVELINAIEIRDTFTTDLIFREEINGEIFDIGIGDVSDGTLHFIAIMSAILGSQRSIGLLIEEPERHMHMKVLSTIIDTMRNDDKQIFFTTHSMEILQRLHLDEILFLYRDYDGNTQGKRARDIHNIKKIMKIYKDDLVEMLKIGILDDMNLEEDS